MLRFSAYMHTAKNRLSAGEFEGGYMLKNENPCKGPLDHGHLIMPS